jgi:hypothetical protein
MTSGYKGGSLLSIAEYPHSLISMLVTGVGTTSESVASIASRGLRFPSSLSLDHIKSVAASALSQAQKELVMGPVAKALSNINDATSQHVASLASRALQRPQMLMETEIKTLCGSVLNQRSEIH